MMKKYDSRALLKNETRIRWKSQQEKAENTDYLLEWRATQAELST